MSLAALAIKLALFSIAKKIAVFFIGKVCGEFQALLRWVQTVNDNLYFTW
jgi:hypothetical protein